MPDARSLTQLVRRLAVEVVGGAMGGPWPRVQAEEVEDLRARLRRAGETRAELDDEIGRLRRALAEADAQVLAFTRRTQELSQLARGAPAASGDGTTADAAAGLDPALHQRDLRIATLEADRQDLEWRLAAAEDKARVAASRASAAGASAAGASAAGSTAGSGVGARVGSDGGDLAQRLQACERAIDDYRRAAAAHVEEVGEINAALAEQAALVAELEASLDEARADAAAAREGSRQGANQDAGAEAADLARRSRLAELEGTLLRVQRESATLAASRAEALDRVRQLEERVRQFEKLEEESWEARSRLLAKQAELDMLEARLTGGATAASTPVDGAA